MIAERVVAASVLSPSDPLISDMVSVTESCRNDLLFSILTAQRLSKKVECHIELRNAPDSE